MAQGSFKGRKAKVGLQRRLNSPRTEQMLILASEWVNEMCETSHKQNTDTQKHFKF